MRNRHSIKTLEQLKVLTHPLRLRILELLIEKPMTTKQVAEALGEDPLKLYYHVEVLEQAGLIELVETRMKANLQEKHYRAVAKDFSVDESLFAFGGREVADTVAKLLNNLLDVVREEVLQGPLAKALKEQPPGHKSYTIIGTHEHIRAGRQAIKELGEKISTLLKEAEQVDEHEGELSYCLTVLFFPLQEQGSSDDNDASGEGSDEDL